MTSGMYNYLEEVVLVEYISNKRFTEPLIYVVWPSHKYHVSEYDNESLRRQWQSDCSQE